MSRIIVDGDVADLWGIRWGVAIKSSLEQYRRAIEFALPQWQYGFGTVEYHEDIRSCKHLAFDFSEGSVPLPGIGIAEKILDLAMHKRSRFEFEKEWRAALYQDLRPGVLGCSIQCNLDDLISAVYVGPRATDFFAQIVGAVMEKFALNKPLHKSELLESPSSGDR